MVQFAWNTVYYSFILFKNWQVYYKQVKMMKMKDRRNNINDLKNKTDITNKMGCPCLNVKCLYIFLNVQTSTDCNCPLQKQTSHLHCQFNRPCRSLTTTFFYLGIILFLKWMLAFVSLVWEFGNQTTMLVSNLLSAPNYNCLLWQKKEKGKSI